MKSCLGMFIAVLLLVAVLGTLGGIWYLSQSAEITRKEAPAAP